MQPEVPHDEHRVNGNTHVKIDLKYLLEIFFGKWYVGVISDIFCSLIIIVYFRTTNLNNTYEQIVLQNSIIAILFTIGIGLLIRIMHVLHAMRYYGQNLRVTEADDKIIFKNNKIYLTFGMVVGVLFQIPRIPLYYYFIPLTKSEMCDLYGPANCDMLKAFCVVNLCLACFLAFALFCGLLILPTYLTGIPKDVAMFVRDNIIGLFLGNIVSVFKSIEVN